MASLNKSQLVTRAELAASETEAAYARLAASVSPSGHAPVPRLENAEEFVETIRLCLTHLGVTPGEAPTGSPKARSSEEVLDWMCRPSGTMHRTITLDDGWHRRAFGVMLGFLDGEEPIALVPSGLVGYQYRDPSSGRKVRVTAKEAARIGRQATYFYRPFPSHPLTTSDLSSFVVSTLSASDYLFAIGATIACTVLGLLPAWANRLAYGLVAPSGQAALVLPIAVLLVCVTLGSSIITICRDLILERLVMKVDAATESATYARMLSLPTGFFRNFASGELARRMRGVTDLCSQVVSILLGSGLSALLSLVYIAQIFSFAPSLMVPALVIIVVEAVLGVASTLLTIRYEQASIEADARTSGIVTTLLNGIQKIQLAGAEDLAFSRWAKSYADYSKATYNRPALISALPALIALIGLVGNICLYYIAATCGVTYDNFIAFSVAYGLTTGAIMTLADIAALCAQAKPLYDMARPILDANPETADNRPSVTGLGGDIEVSGVSFRYGENLPYVLKDLSFHIRPGEYVALVGASGCGKSTIMRLLLGFEEPELGSIFYGSHDVRKVNLRSLRRHIGTVMQDSCLFAGDIFSNITISTPEATLDDAWDAAEIAGIADDIAMMPMGMHTIVSEGGGGLSGGQRQRILIARAVCGKRRILMFDEATSALDNLTQQHVTDALAKLRCTRLVIAHRLSTVRECDRILLVADGNIQEEGTYDELMAKGGRFADLVARQRIDDEPQGS